jgi:G3E family GTPase
LSWDCFRDALGKLADAHGERLLRIKGLLNIRGQQHPSALHGIHHFFHPPLAVKAWPDQDRRSRIIFITDRLPEAAVRAFFTEFLPAERHKPESMVEVA